jgi:hypothetical protein
MCLPANKYTIMRDLQSGHFDTKRRSFAPKMTDILDFYDFLGLSKIKKIDLNKTSDRIVNFYI